MKVLLFAIRSSHQKFFLRLQKEERGLFDICYPRYKLSLSLSAVKFLKEVNLNLAIDFGVEEFCVKVMPLPKKILSVYFRVLVWFYFLKYFSLIDKEYQAILLWNGGKCRQRVIVEIAKLKGIQTLFFENGLLPNRMVLDAKGINAENSVPREKSFFQNYHNSLGLPDSLVPRIAKNRKKFTASLTPLPKAFIFIPFQVDSDTQIITHSKWIKNMRAFFGVIEKLSSAFSYHFVIKEHPSSSHNYQDLHQKTQNLPYLDFANGYATQELIEKSMAVITINSTVGIESLLFKKRVVVLGDAFYRIEGITKGADNFEMLEAIFTDFNHWKYEEHLVENFLKYLYYDYLIPKDEHLYQHFTHFIKKQIK